MLRALAARLAVLFVLACVSVCVCVLQAAVEEARTRRSSHKIGRTREPNKEARKARSPIFVHSALQKTLDQKRQMALAQQFFGLDQTQRELIERLGEQSGATNPFIDMVLESIGCHNVQCLPREMLAKTEENLRIGGVEV